MPFVFVVAIFVFVFVSIFVFVFVAIFVIVFIAILVCTKRPVAIIDHDSGPALPLELAVTLLQRLGRAVRGGHKVGVVRVLQQLFVNIMYTVCAINSRCI